jgi:hypothetical protein
MTEFGYALEDILEMLDEAVQADCEHGVRSLNERAAQKYLMEYPATLAAIGNIRNRIRLAFEVGHD